jgi:hypothetical protein
MADVPELDKPEAGPPTSKSGTAELARAYFSAARSEVTQRLALREQVLLAGFATFGVVGGLAFSNHKEQLLGLFPGLSIAFSLLLFRHHWLITDLSNYINFELTPFLAPETQNDTSKVLIPHHWDSWLLSGRGTHRAPPKRELRNILTFELFGAWILIWGPGLGGLIFVLHGFFNWSDPIVWIDIVLLALSLVPYALEANHLAFRWK